MVILTLNPLSQAACSQYIRTVLQASNPPMVYTLASGTPTAQGIKPPYTNLPAHIDEAFGQGPSYVWNPTLGTWN